MPNFMYVLQSKRESEIQREREREREETKREREKRDRERQSVRDRENDRDGMSYNADIPNYKKIPSAKNLTFSSFFSILIKEILEVSDSVLFLTVAIL